MVNKTSDFAIGDEVKTSMGRIFILTDVNPNKNYKQRDEYFAEGRSGDHFDTFSDHKTLKILRKAADIPRPVIPTLTELVDYAQSAMLDEYDGIRIDESDRDEEGKFFIYGYSPTNQRFSALVTISQIDWADQ